ncbi:hypothetical protein JTB14_004462 [Gonioctena quinquepunctata]|nr:hypothetical protein JTB14_004462 [Gonioctena quinquepunctata]
MLINMTDIIDQQVQNGDIRDEVETREVGEERVTGEARIEAGVEQSGVRGRFETGRRGRGINAASLVNNKETVKLSDLPQNQPQPILNKRIVKSKFGEIPLVKLNCKNIWPVYLKGQQKRFPRIHRSSPPDKYKLVFKGVKGLAHQFEIQEIPRV